MRPQASLLGGAALALWALPGAQAADEGAQVRVERVGGAYEVRAQLVAAATPGTCYATLADFDRLEEFVPDLVSSEVVSAPGEPILLRQLGRASAGPFHASLDVTLAVRETPPVRIDFERVAGNLRQMRGHWAVAGDGAGCRIDYVATIEPDFWVPPFVGTLLMRRQARAQFEGVAAELQRRTRAPMPVRP